MILGKFIYGSLTFPCPKLGQQQCNEHTLCHQKDCSGSQCAPTDLLKHCPGMGIPKISQWLKGKVNESRCKIYILNKQTCCLVITKMSNKLLPHQIPWWESQPEIRLCITALTSDGVNDHAWWFTKCSHSPLLWASTQMEVSSSCTSQGSRLIHSSPCLASSHNLSSADAQDISRTFEVTCWKAITSALVWTFSAFSSAYWGECCIQYWLCLLKRLTLGLAKTFCGIQSGAESWQDVWQNFVRLDRSW